MKVVNKKEIFVSVIFLIISSVLFWQMTLIQSAKSALFVKLCLMVMVISSILNLFKGILSGKSGSVKDLIYKKKELWMLLSLIVYWQLIKPVGFYVATLPFAFSINLLTRSSHGKRDLMSVAVFSILLTAVMFLICQYVLQIKF